MRIYIVFKETFDYKVIVNIFAKVKSADNFLRECLSERTKDGADFYIVSDFVDLE